MPAKFIVERRVDSWGIGVNQPPTNQLRIAATGGGPQGLGIGDGSAIPTSSIPIIINQSLNTPWRALMNNADGGPSAFAAWQVSGDGNAATFGAFSSAYAPIAALAGKAAMFGAAGVPIHIGAQGATLDLSTDTLGAGVPDLRITAAHNVGIGTGLTPVLEKLHVNGNFLLTDTIDATHRGIVENLSGGASALAGWTFECGVPGKSAQIAFFSPAYAFFPTLANKFGIWTDVGTPGMVISAQSGNLDLTTDSMVTATPHVRIDSSGKVGVGTGTSAIVGLFSVGPASQFTVNAAGDILTTGNFQSAEVISIGSFQAGGPCGFFFTGPVGQQVSGANLTNNVTAGGTTDQIDDFAGALYATDATTIRNDIYQLSRKLQQVNDGLRAYGLLT